MSFITPLLVPEFKIEYLKLGQGSVLMSDCTVYFMSSFSNILYSLLFPICAPHSCLNLQFSENQFSRCFSVKNAPDCGMKQMSMQCMCLNTAVFRGSFHPKETSPAARQEKDCLFQPQCIHTSSTKAHLSMESLWDEC